MKDNGGPAFPRPASTNLFDAQEGMSLRDWFAGQALAMGEAVLYGHYDLPVWASKQAEHRVADPKGIARNCYAIADAMLKAREG